MASTHRFERTLIAYFLHVFCYDFMFGYAIFPAYFQLKGTAPELIGIILALWAAGIILFEIPAGLLSDLVDRRLLLTLAPLLKGTCFVIWILAGTQGVPYLFFVGIIFWSLASALRSGTKEALLYEQVAAADKLHRYSNILSKERALQDGATLSGAAIGGLIAGYNLELAFWVSLLPLAVCAVAALFLVDVRKQKGLSGGGSFSGVPGLIFDTWQEYASKPELRYVTLYVVLGVTFLSTLEDFNQLFLLAIGLPVWSIGVAVAVMGTARTALAYFASHLERLPCIFWLIPLLSGCALAVSGDRSGLVSLLCLSFSYILLAPLFVLTMARFQRALDGGSRATSTSVMSAVIESFSVLFNIVIAVLLSRLTVLEVYQVCGLYLIAFALWELWQKRRSSRPKRA
ncbi:MFS transporter [Ponticaulis profundi]|uniref:MFS transporter n=1 Tax=Ponticaulis profundi TaxID=2665222 RepID=A0ABW1S9S3_9PROT